MSDFRIDPEIRDLVPPPSEAERAGLERSILTEGVRDALVVWESGPDRILLDGHNRHDIAIGNNANGEVLPFTWATREFPDKDAAKVWVIENQLEHRRNLSDADKVDLAETKREIIAASQPRGGRPPGEEEKPTQIFASVDSETKPRDERTTNARVGEEAGVSRENVRKYRFIKEAEDSRLVEGLKRKDFSMDNAYHLALVSAECGPETYGALWQCEDNPDPKTGRAKNVRYSTAQLGHLLKLGRSGNPDATTADLVEIVESGQHDPKTGKPTSSVQSAHGLRQAERETSDDEPPVGEYLQRAGVSMEDRPRRSEEEKAFHPVQIKAREIRQWDTREYARACPEIRYLDDAIENFEELEVWVSRAIKDLKEERRESTKLRAMNGGMR